MIAVNACGQGFYGLLGKAAASGGSNPYSHSYSLSIDHTRVPSNRSNYTLRVDTVIAAFKTVANSGSVQHTSTVNGVTVPDDLVFATSSVFSALLTWHFKYYNPATGRIVADVLLPSVSAAVNTTLHIGVGSSAATFLGGSIGAAYDGSVASALLQPDGTTLSGNDFSGGGHNAVVTGATAGAGPGNLNGGFGVYSSASTQNMDVANAVVTGYPFTFDAWTLPGSVNSADNVIMGLVNPAGLEEYWVGYYLGNLRVVIQSGIAGAGAGFTCTSCATTGAHHVVVAFNSTTDVQLYYDGVNTGLSLSGAAPTPVSVSHLYIGGFYYYGSTFYGGFNGSIGEAKVINSAVSADFVTTEYNNLISPYHFYSITQDY